MKVKTSAVKALFDAAESFFRHSAGDARSMPALLFIAITGLALLTAGSRQSFARHSHIPPADEIPDFALRVRIRQAGEEEPAEDDKFVLSLIRGTEHVFTGTGWSPWAESTQEFIEDQLGRYPNAYNRLWQMRILCSVSPRGGPFLPLKMDVEMRLADDEDVQQTPAELLGPRLGLLIWRGTDDETVKIDTLAGHGRRVYDEAMREAVLPIEDRPQHIIFGERYIGGDDDAVAWREGIERLCGLGFNAIHRVPEVHMPVVREGGINRMWGAVYNPPGYAFNFLDDRHEIFEKFVKNQVDSALNHGWELDEIAKWTTSDEPGWYYPARYRVYNENETDHQGRRHNPGGLFNEEKPAGNAAMAVFRDYLTERGLTPDDLGLDGWDELRLTGRREYDFDDLPSRRLFYWSNRFLPWASSRFFAEVTEAYEKVLGDGFPVMVNFNNFLGRLYQPGPVANQPDREDPNAAMGQHCWLEFGRVRGSTCIATEDWFSDAMAPQWSFYSTRLRSAAELSGVGFGALIIPRTSGQRPEGMAQKLLALIGHGSKTIKFFTFGPEYNFPVNCYSFKPEVFEALSLGMGIIGRAEELLYPGTLRKPEVAILFPQSAQLWDLEDQEIASGLLDVTNNNMFRRHKGYMSETYGLHLALQHSAIPVQAIDEEACSLEELPLYRVIYLTAPDLPEETASDLIEWVRNGGTLVMTAGSGWHDRYHQPTDVLFEAAGVRPDKPRRPLLTTLEALTAGPVLDTGDGGLQSYGVSELLEVTEAEVIAFFDNEERSAAITERSLGQGRIVRFASFPGISYRRTATETSDGLPAGFCPGWRKIITSPVIDAGVIPPVRVNAPKIEAPILDSEGGAAVTLLNWSGMHHENAEIAVDLAKHPLRAVSARKGELDMHVSPGDNDGTKFTATVTLDLSDVDVISFYFD